MCGPRDEDCTQSPGYVCGTISFGGSSTDECVREELCGKSFMGAKVTCGGNALVIIIIIIVVLLIAGGVGFFLWKKKKGASAGGQPAQTQQVGNV